MMRLFKIVMVLACALMLAQSGRAQFSKSRPVTLTPDFRNAWYPDLSIVDDTAARKAALTAGITEAQWPQIARLSYEKGGGWPTGMLYGKMDTEKLPAQKYKAYKLFEWTRPSWVEKTMMEVYELLWVPNKENAGMPADLRPTDPMGLFLVVQPPAHGGEVRYVPAPKIHVEPAVVAAPVLAPAPSSSSSSSASTASPSTSASTTSSSSSNSSYSSSSSSSGITVVRANMSQFTQNNSYGSMVLYYGYDGRASRAYVYELRGPRLSDKKLVADELVNKTSDNNFIGFEHLSGYDCRGAEGYIKGKVGSAVSVSCRGEHRVK